MLIVRSVLKYNVNQCSEVLVLVRSVNSKPTLSAIGSLRWVRWRSEFQRKPSGALLLLGYLLKLLISQ